MNGYGRGADHNDRDKSVVTRETVGMTFLIFSVILFVIATIGQFIFGEIGIAITSVLTGITGMLTYPLLALAIYASVCLVAGRSYAPARLLARLGAVVLTAFLIVHLATSTQYLGGDYGSYLGGCWGQESGVTGGGVLYALVVYPVQALLSRVGAYILFSLAVAVSIFFAVRKLPIRTLFERKNQPVATADRAVAPRAVAQADQRYETQERQPIRKTAPQYDTPRYDVPTQNLSQDGALRTYQPGEAGKRIDCGTLGDRFGAPKQSVGGTYYGQAPREEQFLKPTPKKPVGYYGEDTNLVGYYGNDGRRVAADTEQTDRNAGNAWVDYVLKEGKQRANYAPERKPEPESNRDVLFSGSSQDYFRNLIYRDDSYFNTHQRRSSIQPVANGAPTQSEPSETTFVHTPIAERPVERPYRATAPESYIGRYGEQAETPRREMPRKIVEQRPAQTSQYTDLNYPDLPQTAQRDRLGDLRRGNADRSETRASDERLSRIIRNDDAERLPRSRFDEPKQELPRSRFDEPKEELPRSRFDEPKAEELTYEVPKLDEPKAEELTYEVPKLDEPKAEELTYEVPKLDEPKAEELTYEVPKLDEPKAEELTYEVPKLDEPKAEELTYEAPKLDEPKAEDGTPVEDTPTEEEPFDWRGQEQKFRSAFSQPSGEDRIQLKPVEYDFFAEQMKKKEEQRRERERLQAEEQPAEELQASENSPIGFEDEQETQSRAEELLARNVSHADLFDDEEQPMQEIAEETPAFSQTEQAVSQPQPKPIVKRHVHKRYRAPSLDLLRSYDSPSSVSEKEIHDNSETIVETLAGFRVDASIRNVTVGPSVTRYDIDIPRNIAVRSVIKYDAEIAMRLRAMDGVNMYANPEIGAISIEVPNSKRATVGIGSLMNTPEYREKDPKKLTFVVGRDIEGRAVCRDIVKMTHLLVAGTTSSGKSVCLNTMLISLICKYSPEDLRLILIDPKKIEFAPYEGLPHLMINEIVSDAQKAVMALNWTVKEMERRYGLFESKTRSGCSVRNIAEYNSNLTEDEEKLCKIVVVVDELADLMSVAKKEIEERIQRIAQKARAAGIHLVIATQRPSVDVITGVVKSNLPTRIAFRVIQEVDSRTILDETGAQKLLGNGDMMLKEVGKFCNLRVQGAYVDSTEVDAVVNWIKANNEAYFDPEVADYINRENTEESVSSDDDPNESVGPEYLKALAIVVNLGQASISLLQRKCAIGYNHAGKIIEWMEVMGYITRFDGKAKARTVLLTKEEYESKYGSLD